MLRSRLRGLFGYLHQAGHLPEDPSRLIRPALCGEAPPRALSEASQERLLAALAGAEGPTAARDHALFHLLLGTGIRLGSALALQVEDLDLAGGEMRLRSVKGGRTERVFLPPAVGEHLARLLGERASGPVFARADGQPITARQAHRRLRYWLELSGAEAASPHALRHAFAMRLYRRTRDVLLVRRALGHASVSSTLRYARVEDEALRAAMTGGTAELWFGETAIPALGPRSARTALSGNSCGVRRDSSHFSLRRRPVAKAARPKEEMMRQVLLGVLPVLLLVPVARGQTSQTAGDAGDAAAAGLSRLRPLEVGPIPGLTSGWHPAPDRTGVPLGAVVELRQRTPFGARVAWAGVTSTRHLDLGLHEEWIAEIAIDDLGTKAVECAVDLAGETFRRGILFKGVDVSAGLRIERPTLRAVPLDIQRDRSTTREMLHAFTGGSIADVEEVEPGRYLTSTRREVFVEADVYPVELRPLMEIDVDGHVAALGLPARVVVEGPETDVGWHTVGVGPTGSTATADVFTYAVHITVPDVSVVFEEIVQDGVPFVFEARTDPLGYEDRIVWFGSTKFGSVEPMLGRGRTFRALFNETFSPMGQWLGVRGDNAIFSQDLKCTPICFANCDCYFSSDCAVGSTCDYGPGGHTVEDICNFRQPKPGGTPGSGCNEDSSTHSACDGKCTSPLVGSVLGHENPDVVLAGVAGWGRAFLNPASSGGGRVDQDQLALLDTLPFDDPASAELLGRLVGGLFAIVGGPHVFHPDPTLDVEPGHCAPFMRQHLVEDMSSEPWRLAAVEGLINALVSELRGDPAATRLALEGIERASPDVESDFWPACSGPRAMGCLQERVKSLATYIATPRQR